MSSSANSTDTAGPVAPQIDWASIYGGHTDGKRLAAAFLTVVVWDFVITIDDSIVLFWNAPWTLAKAMYTINRYVSLLTVAIIFLMGAMPSPSPLYCIVVPWMEFIGTSIVLAMIGLAMICRVYALWNRDKRILIGTVSVFILNMGSYIVMTAYSHATGSLAPMQTPFTGCLIIPGFPQLWLIFLFNFIFETLIVWLTVQRSWSMAAQTGIRAPLYTMLFADGLAYYWAIIASQVISVVGVMVPSILTFPVVTAFPSIAVTGVACNRLFARLQRLLHGRSKGQSGISTNDFWSADAPEYTFGGSSRADSDSPNARPRAPGSGTTKRRKTDLDSDIALDKIMSVTIPLPMSTNDPQGHTHHSSEPTRNDPEKGLDQAISEQPRS